jgi:hypothetical protein
MPAIVYDDGAGVGAARTHVLIVGVGHYPYLRGGGPDGNRQSILGQIKSPGPSARAFADWFIAEYHYPAAPLGTVALLLSEERASDYRSPHGGSFAPTSADYATVAAQTVQWCERGNGNEASRLIFAFCGHGFGYGNETSLLMSDFDFRAGNPWDSAIDLHKFRAGMEKYAAAEQLFFIDACRQPHGDLVQPGAAIGRTPVSAVPRPRENFAARRRNAPVFFSTGLGEPARARSGDPSVFTSAFLCAVDGMGARDDTGEWVVNNLAMLDAIDHVSRRLTEADFTDPQQPQGNDAQRLELHYLRGEPVSPVYVKRQDGLPCGPGDLRYAVGQELRQRPCRADELEVEVRLPAGTYDFELTDGNGVVSRAPQARSAPIFKYARLT